MGHPKTPRKHKNPNPDGAKREKRAERTRRSDARRREEGLRRICIWLPEYKVNHVTSLAHELVAAHRAAAAHGFRLVGPAMVPIPRPWKNPTPFYDVRQRRLPFKTARGRSCSSERGYKTAG